MWLIFMVILGVHFSDIKTHARYTNMKRSNLNNSPSDELIEVYEEIFGRYSNKRWNSNFAICHDSTVELFVSYLPKYKPKSLLMCLDSLTHMDTESRKASIWNCDEKTYVKHSDEIIKYLSENMQEIEWESRLDSPYPKWGPLKGVTHLVDSTSVRITSFKPKSYNWYNFYQGKKKFHCWKFTGCTSITSGEFCYFDRIGFPGIVHDKTMYDTTVKPLLENSWEWGLGDKGYEGVEKVLSPWKGTDLGEDKERWNALVNRHRALVENAFSRLKMFGVLRGPYHKRYREKIHATAYTCAQLTNLDLKFRPLRKKLHPELINWCN